MIVNPKSIADNLLTNIIVATLPQLLRMEAVAPKMVAPLVETGQQEGVVLHQDGVEVVLIIVEMAVKVEVVPKAARPRMGDVELKDPTHSAATGAWGVAVPQADGAVPLTLTVVPDANQVVRQRMGPVEPRTNITCVLLVVVALPMVVAELGTTSVVRAASQAPV